MLTLAGRTGKIKKRAARRVFSNTDLVVDRVQRQPALIDKCHGSQRSTQQRERATRTLVLDKGPRSD